MQTRLQSCSPPGLGSMNELLRLFPAGPGVNTRMPLTAPLRECLPPSTLLHFGTRGTFVWDPKIPSGIWTDEEVGRGQDSAGGHEPVSKAKPCGSQTLPLPSP